MIFGFGLQRELVERILSNGPDDNTWKHVFGKCLETFMIKESIDHRRLFQAMVSVFESEVSLRSPVLGWPSSEVFEPQPLYSRYCEVPTEELLDTLIECAAPVVMPQNDLSRGAQPFIVYVASPDETIFCIGGDHAYLDGYSLRILLRRAIALIDVDGHEPRCEDGLKHQRASYLEPTANADAAAYFEALAPPRNSFAVPGCKSKRGSSRRADRMKVLTIDPETSAAVDRQFDQYGISPSSGWHVLFQAIGSAWYQSSIPMVYSKVGRTRVAEMSAVGPFYQSHILGSISTPSTWGELLTTGKLELSRTPQLYGCWASDWLDLETLEDYRLLSFNYLSPERGIRLGDVLIETAPGEFVGTFLQETSAIVESRNGLHGAMSKVSSGSYEIWLRVDQDLTGPIDAVCNAFQDGIQSFSQSDSIDQFRKKVCASWGDSV